MNDRKHSEGERDSSRSPELGPGAIESDKPPGETSALPSGSVEKIHGRKRTLTRVLVLATVVAIVLAATYVLLPRTNETLVVKMVNRTDIDREVFLEIDGVSVPSFAAPRGEFIDHATDFSRNTVHTVAIWTSFHEPITVKTRPNRNMYFELFSDGTITHSYWDDG